MWAVVCTPEGEIHIEPLSDREPHEHCETCWCQPTIEDDAWVHHSADGREKKELN